MGRGGGAGPGAVLCRYYFGHFPVSDLASAHLHERADYISSHFVKKSVRRDVEVADVFFVGARADYPARPEVDGDDSADARFLAAARGGK